jgi:cysteine-rich repeat protein
MRALITAAVAAAFVGVAPAAHATDIQGTVTFQGMVVFAAPIPGIDATDLTVAPKATSEATGNGETCTVLNVTSDSPDGTGAYPDAGTVSVEILLHRGGPQVPDGECIVALQATGTDGVATSARGSQTVFLDAAEIGGNANVAVPDITVRQSKAVAGLDIDCLRWLRKQLRVRSRCNFLLLKGGPAFASRCRDFSADEPPGCDPGEHVAAILGLSHGPNDQQTDPPNAEGVDFDVLRSQVICQRLFGRAAFAFAVKRSKLVNNLCIVPELDSEDCRADRSRDSRRPLDAIDRCGVAQMVDGGTGRSVPTVGAPCDACIDGGGAIDRKCLKSCFQTAVDELSDGIVGDVPVCGNGIQQGGEFCDDGNTSNADCCSDACAVLPNPPGTEGPMADPSCNDGVDNDCDDATDGADPDCQ